MNLNFPGLVAPKYSCLQICFHGLLKGLIIGAVDGRGGHDTTVPVDGRTELTDGGADVAALFVGL